MDGRGNHRELPAAVRRRRTVTAAVVAAACSAVLLVQCLLIGKNSSLVVDETPYLASALQTRHDGALDPRLVRAGVAPLPILFNYLPALAASGRAEARASIWIGKPEDAKAIAGPRLLTMLFAGVPLVIAVFVWLCRRRGMGAATIGALLMALSPSLAAHASIATTDATFALWSTLSVLALAAYTARPTFPRLALSGALIGVAMTAKYSGVYLIACAGVLIAARTAWPAFGTGTHGLRTVSRALGKALLRFGALLVLAFTVWWAGHAFAVTGPLSETSFAETKASALAMRVLGRGEVARFVIDFAHTRLPEPAPLRGLLFQVSHNRLGQEAFLMGERSQLGWPSFFPMAYALKSTPVELGLTVLLVALLARAALSLTRGSRTFDPAMATLALCGGTYAALLLTSHIDIGHRFLLPVYSLVILAACDRLGASLNGRRALLAMVGIAVVGAQAVSAASVWPHSLSYFNAFAGGPANGWHRLVDSSIDWGQDLPALARVLNSEPEKPTALSYFGSAVPAAYGVRADDIRALTRSPDEYDRVAISVTHLQGLYVKGTDAFRWFLDQTPSAKAGYSIFVYDLDTPERRAALRAAVAAITSGG